MLDYVDAAGAFWFLAVAIGLPLFGWIAMGLDYRAYVRSLRRKLVAVRQYSIDIPKWVLRERPPCFEELGVAPDATRDEVLAAYRRRVKEVHPDRGGDRRRFDRLQRRLEEALALVDARS